MSITNNKKDKKTKKELSGKILSDLEEKIDENLSFSNDTEIILSDKEAKDLEVKLQDMKVDEQTKKFFKTTKSFYKKLKTNDFIITLEELENE
ncbi:MAG TPA: hypothetical protein VMV49_18395 [Candidatus Deferrimicrobium sp.]|nr:hypothetical protein [Candidatus Deferrimicrobium sp.]